MVSWTLFYTLQWGKAPGNAEEQKTLSIAFFQNPLQRSTDGMLEWPCLLSTCSHKNINLRKSLVICSVINLGACQNKKCDTNGLYQVSQVNCKHLYVLCFYSEKVITHLVRNYTSIPTPFSNSWLPGCLWGKHCAEFKLWDTWKHWNLSNDVKTKMVKFLLNVFPKPPEV